jgi:hypothetical protein
VAGGGIIFTTLPSGFPKLAKPEEGFLELTFLNSGVFSNVLLDDH